MHGYTLARAPVIIRYRPFSGYLKPNPPFLIAVERTFRSGWSGSNEEKKRGARECGRPSSGPDSCPVRNPGRAFRLYRFGSANDDGVDPTVLSQTFLFAGQTFGTTVAHGDHAVGRNAVVGIELLDGAGAVF